MFFYFSWFVAGLISVAIPCVITWFEDGELDVTLEGIGMGVIGFLLGYISLALMICFGASHMFEKYGSKSLYKISKKDD